VKITKAKARVLIKAYSSCVMISGEFSGMPSKKCIKTRNFDRRRHVEELFALGLIRAGDGYNQFVCSELGRSTVEKLPPSLRFNLDVLTEQDEKTDETILL
jgi:hypothetical protein